MMKIHHGRVVVAGIATTMALLLATAGIAHASGYYYGVLQKPYSGTLVSSITAEGCKSNIKSSPTKAWTDWNDDVCNDGQFGQRVGVRVLYPGGTYSSWDRDWDLADISSTTHLQAQYEMGVGH